MVLFRLCPFPGPRVSSAFLGALLLGLLSVSGLSAASLSTQDGLALTLARDGRVVGLTAGSQRLPIVAGGGCYALDLAGTTAPSRAGLAPVAPAASRTQPTARTYLRTALDTAKGMWVQRGKLPALGLKLQISYAASGEYLSCSGRVENLTVRDRAVEVGYEIPLAAVGWTWGDDLTHSRKIVAGETYRDTWQCPAGPGYNAAYPFSSLAFGDTGLSLGVPLAQGPRVYSVEYDAARQCLLIRFHFGLSKQVKRLPGQAWFSFLLYRHDGRWGWRAAADRYYQLFPQDFRKRVPYEGYLGYAHLETSDGIRGSRELYGLPAAGDFGRGFRWLWHQHTAYSALSYDVDEAAHPTDETVYKLLKQASAAQGPDLKYGWQQQQLALLGKPRLMEWEEPAWSLLRRLYTDRDGRIVWVGDSAYTPPHDDKPGRWLLNFQVNDDPDLSPALRDSLEATLAQWRQREPQAKPFTWCISNDGTGFTGRQLDFRAEHLAVSDVPLTYDHETLRPALADPAWEFNAQVLAPLSEKHRFLMLRNFMCGTPYVGANLPFFDLGLIECAYGKWGWDEASDLYARTSAYRRPLRYWCYLPTGEQRPAAVREMFERGLLYAIYPHLLPDAAAYRDLYLRYVPVIERLSAAGWEPVTRAQVSEPDLHVERFGRLGDANLAFTARNVGTATRRVRLYLDPSLGLPTLPERLQVRDLLTGEPVNALADREGLALPLILEPGQTVAYSVLTTEKQLHADLLAASRCLREAALLVPAEELTYQVSRPGELLVGDTPPTVRADTILADGWVSYQGLIWSPDPAPLTLTVDLNSPHRLSGLRLHGGAGEAYELPTVKVEAQDRDGQWTLLGSLPAATAAAGTLTQTLELKTTLETQVLRLTWPPLNRRLWLKEIEIEGEDAALVRAADRFESLAQQAATVEQGLLGQLAVALRVRRMLGHDKTLQEQALTHLSDFTSTATGVFVSLEYPADAPAAGEVKATLVALNRGSKPLTEGNIKLKLPPGWSAAPTKFDFTLSPGQTLRLPVTLVRAAEGGHLTLLVTGSSGEQGLFMSRWL